MAKTATKKKPGKASAAHATKAADETDVRKKAQDLLREVERERAGQTLRLGVVIKGMKATKDVLAADLQVQVEFVRHVVGVYAKLGKAKGEWFRKPAVPSGGAEVVRLLLRRKLPLTDETLAEMFEQMSGVSYLPLVEFNEQLAMALEKRADGEALSPRLRKAAKAFADVLAVRHVSAAEAKRWREEWNFPRSDDLKTVVRIDKVLA
jgi:hypothetical protein